MPDNALFITSGGQPDVVRREAESMMPNLGMGNWKPDFVEDAKVVGLPADAAERDWPPRTEQKDRKQRNVMVAEAEKAKKALEAIASRRSIIKMLTKAELQAMREAEKTGYLTEGLEINLPPEEDDDNIDLAMPAMRPRPRRQKAEPVPVAETE